MVLEVQGAGRVEHRIHKDVRLALLQHVQDLLQVGATHTHKGIAVLGPHGGATGPPYILFIYLFINLFTDFLFDLKQVGLQTLLHLARLFLSSRLLRAQPGDLVDGK